MISLAVAPEIRKIFLKSTSAMRKGFVAKIVGKGFAFLINKYKMPFLIKFFRVLIPRFSVLWPNILYYDGKKYLKKLIKAFSVLIYITKIIFAFYICCFVYRIFSNILAFNSKGSSLEYGLELIKDDFSALKFILEWFILRTKGLFGGDSSSSNPGQNFNNANPGSDKPGG